MEVRYLNFPLAIATISTCLAIPLTVISCLTPAAALGNESPLGTTPMAIAQIFPDIFPNPDAWVYLRADSLLRQGFTVEALQVYEDFLERLREQEKYTEMAELLSNIGSNLRFQGDLTQAIIYYQQALALYLDLNVTFSEPGEPLLKGAEAANALGEIYQSLDQPEEAIASYQKALTLSRSEGGDRFTEASTLEQMAITYRTTGDIDQALVTAQEALTIHESIGSGAYYIPLVYIRMGLLQEDLGNITAAIAAYEKALATLPNTSEFMIAFMQVLPLENLSRLYDAQGQRDQAAHYDQKAQAALDNAATTEMGLMPSRTAMVLSDIGDFYLADRRLAQAAAYFDRAVAIARQSPDQYAEITTINSIKVAYTQQGRFASLIPYQVRLLEIEQAMGLSGSKSTEDLAYFYQTMGDFSRALSIYQKAIALYQADAQEYGEQTISIGGIHRRLGQIYIAQGQPTEAIANYQQAFDLYEEALFYPGQISVLESLASLYAAQSQPE
ncbi:MAG: tetratricopeptide repeat protein, partial [Synechococcus sp.]|nr:tetratricopeptide repeat protein [Synechococcus sp.]